MDGERASVERERSGVGGSEGEDGGAVDDGGREIEVESEGDVRGERVS